MNLRTSTLISGLQFDAGAVPGSPALQIRPGNVCLLVGPNNAGKSLALRSIYHALSQPYHAPGKVVSRVDTLRPATLAELESFVESDIHVDAKGYRHFPAAPGRGGAHHYDPAVFEKFVADDRTWKSFLASNYTLVLDGSTRLSLTSELPAADLCGPPTNHLLYLFRHDHVREQLRTIIHAATGKYLVIDPTKIGLLRMRLSDRPPEDRAEEQNWDARARSFHAAAQAIDEYSDGVRSFVGIVTAIVGSTRRIVLLDEPEAFLHPPLARRLGAAIAAAATERHLSVVAATHSADFLAGCIESGASVEVVRLTFDGTTATARHLPPDALRLLMRDPLLRANDLLRAVFSDAAVFTESPSDQAFYSEINFRLQQLSPPEGISGGVFGSAQSKQLVPRLLQPLRKLGIAAVGVVDIDVLKDGGKTWTQLLSAIGVPSGMHSALSASRAAALASFERTGANMKRGGIKLLEEGDRESVSALLTTLGQYGLFVVPHGELESWLAELSSVGHGPHWVTGIFERMGTDPSDPNYLRPGGGDVWEFMRAVTRWIVDPMRKGLPRDPRWEEPG